MEALASWTGRFSVYEGIESPGTGAESERFIAVVPINLGVSISASFPRGVIELMMPIDQRSMKKTARTPLLEAKFGK
jgi:hypothetical protein